MNPDESNRFHISRWQIFVVPAAPPLQSLTVQELTGLSDYVRAQFEECSRDPEVHIVKASDIPPLNPPASRPEGSGLCLISSESVIADLRGLSRPLPDQATRSSRDAVQVRIDVPRPPSSKAPAAQESYTYTLQPDERVTDLLHRSFSEFKREHALRIQAPRGTATGTHIDFPRSQSEYLACLKLRFLVYRQAGLLQDPVLHSADQLDIDGFDEDAVHLVARDANPDQLVGCVRIILPRAFHDDRERKKLGLPSELRGWFRAVRGSLKDHGVRRSLQVGSSVSLPAAALKALGVLRQSLASRESGLRSENLCELSRVVVAEKHRGQGIAKRLIEAALQVAGAWMHRKYMVLECREEHRALYERFQFQAIHGIHAESTAKLSARAIVMWRTLESPLLPATPANLQVSPAVSTTRYPPDREWVDKLRARIPAELWLPCEPEVPYPGGAATRSKGEALGSLDLALRNPQQISQAIQGMLHFLAATPGHSLSLTGRDARSLTLSAGDDTPAKRSRIVTQLKAILQPSTS